MDTDGRKVEAPNVWCLIFSPLPSLTLMVTKDQARNKEGEQRGEFFFLDLISLKLLHLIAPNTKAIFK